MIKKTAQFILFLGFAFCLVSQLHLVQVQANSHSPVSSPLTSPISGFVVYGTVTYHRLGRLMKPLERMVPAPGVVVKVTDFFKSKKSWTTMTDDKGNYSVPVDPGQYIVTVKDGNHTFFTPPQDVVKVKNHSVKANFEGLVFPKF